LIDINPRFSAGIAFTTNSGYDVVLNHLRCFNNEDIDKQIDIKEQIIIKKFDEVIF
jgi:carbamoyl-phosphate synthase large subunit